MIDAVAEQLEHHGKAGHTGLGADAPLVGDVDPDVLHRLRIALRRLRAVWSAYALQIDRGMNTRERALYRYLASAVGKSRDWDVLITLLSASSSGRDEVAAGAGVHVPSAVASSHIDQPDIRAMLHSAVHAARLDLDAASPRRAVRRSGGPQFLRAQSQSHAQSLQGGRRRSCGTLRAGTEKRADYAAFNDMRRAGTKLNYLIEFFKPVLVCSRQDVARNLKRIHKRFGKLNDVVACEALLRENPGLLSDREATRRALVSLQRERRRRMRAASRLLARC